MCCTFSGSVLKLVRTKEHCQNKYRVNQVINTKKAWKKILKRVLHTEEEER